MKNIIGIITSICLHQIATGQGFPQESTSELVFLNFDLPEKEMRATIQSVYRNQSHEFGKFAKSAKSAKPGPSTHDIPQSDEGIPEEEEPPTQDFLKSTPMIPDEVFDKLPPILYEGSKVYSDKRKRDAFLTGAIAMISGCLPKVTGVYFQERVYPPLNIFIIAPAASGKGVLKNAKRLVQKYHDEAVSNSKEAKKKYEAELLDYNDKKRKRKSGEPLPDAPQKPPFRIVLIPADCSLARLVEHLQNNAGRVLFVKPKLTL
ncbi:MAG: DUF3987 domain-containing protein [Saprospiraceae bacterium]|nr:DUF3987 domain-containing protein [Saprospiraceae bacterium]